LKVSIHRTVLVSLVFLACVGCDQITKGVAREHLVTGESHSFLGDTFRLIHAENTGAFLSLGDALPERLRSAIFIGGAAILCLAALWAALLARDLGRSQVVALSLIASGGISNWIDRLIYDGRVTDFLNLGLGGLRTGIFNVADMALMLGVGLYFLSSLRHSQTSRT
jgi:signal peptidase II